MDAGTKATWTAVNCSCINCTSYIHVGRIYDVLQNQEYIDAGAFSRSQ